MCWGC